MLHFEEEERIAHHSTLKFITQSFCFCPKSSKRVLMLKSSSWLWLPMAKMNDKNHAMQSKESVKRKNKILFWTMNIWKMKHENSLKIVFHPVTHYSFAGFVIANISPKVGTRQSFIIVHDGILCQEKTARILEENGRRRKCSYSFLEKIKLTFKSHLTILLFIVYLLNSEDSKTVHCKVRW